MPARGKPAPHPLVRNAMAKQNWQQHAAESESISDQEIWFAIRCLDPEISQKPSNVTAFVALFAVIVVIGAICISLHLRGL
jgi:hypothetical protein